MATETLETFGLHYIKDQCRNGLDFTSVPKAILSVLSLVESKRVWQVRHFGYRGLCVPSMTSSAQQLINKFIAQGPQDKPSLLTSYDKFDINTLSSGTLFEEHSEMQIIKDGKLPGVVVGIWADVQSKVPPNEGEVG